MDPAIKWLVFEGIAPLLGATLLYLANSGCSYIVAGRLAPWRHAVDSMGWLYGGAVLAMQSGFRGYPLDKAGVLPAVSFVAAGACLLILLTAMNERGRNDEWVPGNLLKFSSGVMVGVILWSGYSIQKLASSGA